MVWRWNGVAARVQVGCATRCLFQPVHGVVQLHRVFADAWRETAQLLSVWPHVCVAAQEPLAHGRHGLAFWRMPQPLCLVAFAGLRTVLIILCLKLIL